LYFVSERAVIESVRQSDVTSVISDVYASMARGRAVNFPVIRETLHFEDAIFGFKSGFNKSDPLLGVKAGGLWPGNRAKGIPNHQSTILLFDPESGAAQALVFGTYLTALRTAAASALSVRHLARSNSQILGIIGAGGQAEFQIRANLAERDFTKLMIGVASENNIEKLRGSLSDLSIEIEVATHEDVARSSDVLITVTPSIEPFVKEEWIRPGTHIACMGADTKGKNEVAPTLVSKAQIFCDEPSQATSIGECQHAFAAGLISEADIKKIGDLIEKQVVGRQNDDQITLFDSTGVGLQDLAAARLALDLARAAGLAEFVQAD